jgi:hypothetical protein
MNKIRLFVVGTLICILILFIYSRLSESKKRYLRYLTERLPYMPFRYFV